MEKANKYPDFIDPAALDEIRANADWKRVVERLGIQLDTRRSKVGDWWAHSPFGEDNTPSFHMKPAKEFGTVSQRNKAAA